MVFVHHVHAMSDAIGMSLLDCGTNVKGETVGWNHARFQLARMQRDVDIWIKRAQSIDHLHVQPIIGHADFTILRLDKIETYNARIGGGYLKTEKDLCEDDFLREPA